MPNTHYVAEAFHAVPLLVAGTSPGRAPDEVRRGHGHRHHLRRHLTHRVMSSAAARSQTRPSSYLKTADRGPVGSMPSRWVVPAHGFARTSCSYPATRRPTSPSPEPSNGFGGPTDTRPRRVVDVKPASRLDFPPVLKDSSSASALP